MSLGATSCAFSRSRALAARATWHSATRRAGPQPNGLITGLKSRAPGAPLGPQLAGAPARQHRFGRTKWFQIETPGAPVAKLVGRARGQVCVCARPPARRPVPARRRTLWAPAKWIETIMMIAQWHADHRRRHLGAPARPIVLFGTSSRLLLSHLRGATRAFYSICASGWLVVAASSAR